MALITCPECKNQISENAVSCPKCGFRSTHKKLNDLSNDFLGMGCSIMALPILIIIIIILFSILFG